MVCIGLPAFRGVGHHAPSIFLGNLDFSIALSLESHRHLRISIIDSIVGEFPAVRVPSTYCTGFMRSTRLPVVSSLVTRETDHGHTGRYSRRLVDKEVTEEKDHPIASAS
jgi:hypothetical protein